MVNSMVYLIHFNSKYKHALHYIGYTNNLTERIQKHKIGKGARLLQVINDHGITWEVVRIWKDANRKFELNLKKQKNAKRFCPICKGDDVKCI